LRVCEAYKERANSRYLELLRARRERPGSRAAEKRDELAPFHCALRPVLATGTVAHTSMRQETAALRNFYPAYDRCGSIAPDRHDRGARPMSAPPPIAVKHWQRSATPLLPKAAVSRCSKMTFLFDHLVGEREEIVGDFDAKRLGGFEVDYQLELG
jgi:hypothetical protein